MSVSLQQPVRPVDADVAAVRPARPRAALAVAVFGFATAPRCRRVVRGAADRVPAARRRRRAAGRHRQRPAEHVPADGLFGIAIYAAVVAAQASLLRGLRTSLTATVILLAVTATVRRTAAQWHHPQERCTPQPLGRTTRCRPSR